MHVPTEHIATQQGCGLLLLMTVGAKALLALVGCYLMTFTFLTARHNSFGLMSYLNELMYVSISLVKSGLFTIPSSLRNV